MKRILIIEDNIGILENVTEMLVLEGYEVFSAGNGKDGIETFFHSLPNLVICDISMQEMDGFEVLKVLRSGIHSASIPLIFLTSRSERKDKEQGFLAGAQDYLIKPFTYNELLAAVERQI